MMRTVRNVIVAFALAGSAAACSTNQYHTAVVSDTALVQALHVAVQSEQAAFDAKLYPPAQHQQYAAALLKVLQAADAVNSALMAWKPNTPQPAAVANAIAALAPVLAEAQKLAPHAKFLTDLQAVLALFKPAA